MPFITVLTAYARTSGSRAGSPIYVYPTQGVCQTAQSQTAFLKDYSIVLKVTSAHVRLCCGAFQFKANVNGNDKREIYRYNNIVTLLFKTAVRGLVS